MFYICEIWSATSREECRLWVLENKFMRKVKTEEVTWGWGTLHNEVLPKLYLLFTKYY
jgi:hypothetical protein